MFAARFKQAGHPGWIVALLFLFGALLVLSRSYASVTGVREAGVTPGLVDESQTPQIGAPAPDFVLEQADGSLLRLSDLRGNPVILHFWADRCRVCDDVMRTLQQVAGSSGQDLIVLVVNAGNPVEAGERALVAADIDVESVYDLQLKVTNGYGVIAMPATYVLDADGTIVSYRVGYIEPEDVLDDLEAAR